LSHYHLISKCYAYVSATQAQRILRISVKASYVHKKNTVATT